MNTFDRRRFLRSALATSTLATLASHAPPFLCQTALAVGPRQPRDGREALVVIELSGGNDGLNTVVPYDDDEYARKRSTLRLTARDVLRVDDSLGFHPELRDIHRLHAEGRLAVIQGVGYPHSSRNHDDAKRDWETAHPDDPWCQTGWIGRFADDASAQAPDSVPAALVSSVSRPLALASERAILPSIERSQDLDPDPHADPGHLRTPMPPQAHPGANPLLELVRASAANAVAWRDRLRAATRPSEAPYPQIRLATRLRTIAGLIRAEVGFRIFYTELGGDGFGGFDTHANQKENHAALLRQLSQSIAAFLDDLRTDGLDTRVALITVSEFGRTLTESGRGGTNHGAAAPVLLAGGAIRGGVIGRAPDLRDLDQDAPRPHTDFRQIYAAALDDWLGCDSERVLGSRFDPLPLFRA